MGEETFARGLGSLQNRMTVCGVTDVDIMCFEWQARKA